MATFKTILSLLLLGLIPVLVSITWQLMEGIHEDRVQCDSRHFRLSGMEECRPLLECRDINQQVSVHEVIGRGAVKVVKRGEWFSHSVAVNTLANKEYREDFLHGLHMLRQLQSSVKITQLIGACEQQDVFITEFHPLGSADRLEQTLEKDQFHVFNTLSVRFGLCEDYVHILYSLHSGADGARVMCDSNDVNKTLSQFLLQQNFSLLLNDVDALPLVNKSQGQLIKCGHRELFGQFVAPEQCWPHDDRDFDDSEMPGYDEKVDIWKVPDVCETFVGHIEGSAKLRLHLLSVHLKCKNFNPAERPSASDVMETYKNIRKKLQL